MTLAEDPSIIDDCVAGEEANGPGVSFLRSCKECKGGEKLLVSSVGPMQ